MTTTAATLRQIQRALLSETFPGIAEAAAAQWGAVPLQQESAAA